MVSPSATGRTRAAPASRAGQTAEQIGPIVTLVARRPRPAAAVGPNARHRALLADAGLVLPPELDRLAPRMRRDNGSDQIGKVYGMARPSAAPET